LTDTRPLILLTNDDGIRSPGLMAAVAAVHGLGDLLVVAPATQQTGMGRSTPAGLAGEITEEPFSVDGDLVPAYAVPGTPAQTVMFGVLAVAPRRPDLVIAGVNYGENLGAPITASGTVGAALEAAAMGIPALAVSLETPKAYHFNHGGDVEWGGAIDVIRRLARLALAHSKSGAGSPWPPDVDVLNVNIPANATLQTPWRITRQSRQSYFVSFRTDADPHPARAQLDYQVMIDESTLEPDSDVQAFAVDHVISITPLSINLTSRTDLAALGKMIVTD
jgi:5'-nucleotidase